jgi:hypothetical protein
MAYRDYQLDRFLSLNGMAPNSTLRLVPLTSFDDGRKIED